MAIWNEDDGGLSTAAERGIVQEMTAAIEKGLGQLLDIAKEGTDVQQFIITGWILPFSVLGYSDSGRRIEDDDVIAPLDQPNVSAMGLAKIANLHLDSAYLAGAIVAEGDEGEDNGI